MDLAQHIPRGWGQNPVLTDCDISTCLHPLNSSSLLPFYAPSSFVSSISISLWHHLPSSHMFHASILLPLKPFFSFPFPHLHFSSVFPVLPTPCAKPRLDVRDTKRESMVSILKELQTSGEKNTAVWNVWKWKPIETLFLLLSVFFPCAIEDSKMFSHSNMGKKGFGILQHHFLISWVGFLLPERLVPNLHPISFWVKRNVFVIAIYDYHRKSWKFRKEKKWK